MLGATMERIAATIENDGSNHTPRWPRWKFAAVLFPFGAAAVAINLVLTSLLGARLGLPVLSPVAALPLSLPLGIPATWAASRQVDRLLDETED